jgi:hypothetical protein
VKLRFVALAGLLAACGASTPPAGGQAGRDAAPGADGGGDAADPSDAGFVDSGGDGAGAADAGGEVAGDGAGPAACPESAPASRWAEWRIPEPGAAGGPGAQRYDLGGAGRGVVTDQVTGLVWQRQPLPGTHGWADARAACACLALAGHDDWRLPTRMELVSLVDYTRSEPAIDVAAFPDTAPVWFWTSSLLADDSLAPGATFAWFVYFENGYSNFHETDAAYRVRCVRDPGPPPAAGARYLAGADTVVDQRTGLTWQRTIDGRLRTWADAGAYCASPGLPGAGWRLPTMKELQSIVDEARANPAIDPLFGDTPLEPFWTATPVVAAPGSAWRVSFPHGYTYDATATHEYYARCVR